MGLYLIVVNLLVNARTFQKCPEVGREILAKGALEKRGLRDECDSNVEMG